MRPQYEVADIFRQYGDEYRKTHIMTADQRKVMAAITAYRTAKLGGHEEISDNLISRVLPITEHHMQHCEITN